MNIDFLGQTNPDLSYAVSSERTVNLVPRIHGSGSKARITLVGTPGTSLYTTVGSEPIRGMHVFNDLLYVVSGNSLYSVNTYGEMSDSLGTLITAWGRVSMQNNGLTAAGAGGNQLVISDGSDTYIYNVLTGVFSSHGKSASMTTYIDGYFVNVVPNSMSYEVSNLYDGTTWSALASSPVSATPDRLKAVANLHQQLWLIKECSTEIWYNAGIATSVGSPFLRISGAVIDYGTYAPWSVARGDNSMFFLAWQKNGDTSEMVGVVRIDGYTPKVISTEAINYRISQMSAATDAIGYCYSDSGHTYYVITFPSGDATYVYDALTGMWHERSTYKEPYTIGRHIGNCYAFYDNKHLIGDWQTGNIYVMSSAYKNDNGSPIVSMRQAPVIFDYESFDNVFISRLIIEAETGVGDLATTDPKAYLSWSDDNCNTWSGDYECSLGRMGEYGKVLCWNSLGYTKKGRVFRITLSDPVTKVLIGAYAEISQ